MDLGRLHPLGDDCWQVEPSGAMRVPGLIFGDAALVADMDDKVLEQLCNVAALPGICGAAYAMPDAHWGYGFPIGGVAAFDPREGGVISAGGVGFDISCGVRTLLTGLPVSTVKARLPELADALFARIPAGMGSRGALTLSPEEMESMLEGGARWAVAQGWGELDDLAHIESLGRAEGARPDCVSDKAKQRQRQEMGTLGSGNHYLEVQAVARIFDPAAARAYGLVEGEVAVSIHCGSRGLGHQIGTDYLAEMAASAAGFGLKLPDRELASAPLTSALGQRYLGAMRAGINCALANRQIIAHLTRAVFAELFDRAALPLLFDVSHNTCQEEEHLCGGRKRRVFVHRKGATRAFGPHHPSLPPAYAQAGQPVLIGGSMGTASYVLAGTEQGEERSLSSACHGAGRAMSRHAALKSWRGEAVIHELATQGIQLRSPSKRGVAEEAPGAYKDVTRVVEASHRAGLARKVALLRPLACIKG